MLLNWNIWRRELYWVCFWSKREQQSAWCLGGDYSICGDQTMRQCNSHGFCGWSFGVWACMCVMKGDRRKDCKGAVVQKDKRKWNLWLRCNIMQAVLYFIQLETGSQWSCCRRGVLFWLCGALRTKGAAVFWTFCIGQIALVTNLLCLHIPPRWCNKTASNFLCIV